MHLIGYAFGPDFQPKDDLRHILAMEPTNKSETTLAFRAIRDQGSDYSHAGCLAKITNVEIGLL